MKNKIFLLFVLVSLAGHIVNAQSLTPYVISSSGGYYSSADGSLSAAVAEMTMVQTLSSMGYFLTQGFQQPGEWYASVPDEPLQGNLSLYPNPGHGNFNVTMQSWKKVKHNSIFMIYWVKRHFPCKCPLSPALILSMWIFADIQRAFISSDISIPQ